VSFDEYIKHLTTLIVPGQEVVDGTEPLRYRDLDFPSDPKDVRFIAKMGQVLLQMAGSTKEEITQGVHRFMGAIGSFEEIAAAHDPPPIPAKLTFPQAARVFTIIGEHSGQSIASIVQGIISYEKEETQKPEAPAHHEALVATIERLRTSISVPPQPQPAKEVNLLAQREKSDKQFEGCTALARRMEREYSEWLRLPDRPARLRTDLCFVEEVDDFIKAVLLDWATELAGPRTPQGPLRLHLFARKIQRIKARGKGKDGKFVEVDTKGGGPREAYNAANLLVIQDHRELLDAWVVQGEEGWQLPNGLRNVFAYPISHVVFCSPQVFTVPPTPSVLLTVEKGTRWTRSERRTQEDGPTSSSDESTHTAESRSESPTSSADDEILDCEQTVFGDLSVNSKRTEYGAGRPALDLETFPRITPLNIKELKVGGIELSKSQVASLLDQKAFMSSHHIDAFAHILSEAQQEVLVLQSVDSRRIQRDRVIHDRVLAKIRGSRAVIFPLCVDDHWVIIVVKPGGSVLVCNSVNGHARKAVEDFVELLAGLLPVNTRRTAPQFPQQKDACSCGVFACMAMFAMTFQMHFVHPSPTEWRAYLYACMRKEKLFLPPGDWVRFQAKEPRATQIFRVHAEVCIPSRVVMCQDAAAWKPVNAPFQFSALSQGTIRSHRRWRDWIIEGAKKQEGQKFLIPSILEQLLALKRQRQFAYATLSTYIGQIAGVLSRLDQYVVGPGGLPAEALAVTTHSVWSDFRRAAEKKARWEARIVKPTLVKQHIVEIAKLLDGRVRLVFLLSWRFAARPLNTMNLRKQDLIVEDNNILKIIWANAKTSGRRGIYTTAAAVDEEIKVLIASLQPGQEVVQENNQPSALRAIRTAIRKVAGSHFDMRSIRRGALTTMALSGVPLTDLMLVSGHTTEKSLMTYLGYGTSAVEYLERMIKATRAL